MPAPAALRPPTLVALLALAACGPARPAITPPTTSENDLDAWPRVPPDSAGRVTLVEAGQAPTAPLRYAPQVGDHRRVLVQDARVTEVQRAGQAATARTSQPTTVVTLDLDITDVAADGRFRLTYTVSGVALVPGTGETDADRRDAAAELERLRGATGWFVLDARGRRLAAWSDDADLAPEVRALVLRVEDYLEDLVVLLPEEPVGAGARWRIDRWGQHRGDAVTDEATIITLDARDGDAWRARVDATLGGQATLAPRGVPAGVRLEVQHVEGRVRGKVVIDPRGLTGARSQLDADVRGRLRFIGADGKAGEWLDVTLRLTQASAVP